MFRRNDISSAEKLIRIIREDHDGELSEPQLPPVIAPHPGGKTSFLKKIISSWKRAAIGIEIGYDRVRFVKISGGPDQNRDIEDYLSVPYDPQLARDEKQFSNFLKANLKKISGFSRNIELWIAIPPDEMDIRYLEIPTVPKKQIPNAVSWTYHKKFDADKDDIFFDFEVLDHHSRKETNKTAVLAFSIPKKEVQAYKDLFSGIHLPLKGISASSFAFQNLLKLNYIPTGGQSVCCLHIGMNQSRIDLFFPDGTLALSRKIKACMKHMIDDIQKDLGRHLQHELQKQEPRVAPAKQNLMVSKPNPLMENAGAITVDQAQTLLTGMIQNVPPSAILEQWALDLEESSILEMVVPALKRIVWRVERTIEYFCTEIGGPEVGILYVSGKVSGCRQLVEYIERQCDFPLDVKVLDPFAKQISLSKPSILPSTLADRNSLGTAVGIALSKCFSTPNFLFSHIQKEKYEFTKRMHQFLMGALILIFVMLAGIFAWQDTLLKKKNAKIQDLKNRLESRIAENGVYVDLPLIEQQVKRAKQKRENLKSYTRRHLSLVAIKGVSLAVPPGIRLTGLDTRIDSEPNRGKDDRKGDRGIGSITVEGVIFGDPLQFESLLIEFISNIRNQPIFGSPKTGKKTRDQIDGKTVLRFTLDLAII